ncbi:MAG: hypothetical protein DI586_03625 [Micavibrio aeruginosavorus]|uniref:Ppx/GppA phosphatase N-terminal domain-containing protein n=1 Tax=Micavibrio aeruginosavorus TaxID=349221 RepID=A0A2W5HL74_9BACT|nr:MAG: hypothetical protein DI586_03625 [Micavibrio aeruginosavorus]
MKNKDENIAIVDIGSNSVRLFIFSIEEDRAEQISAMKFFCGLGKDLGTTGLLHPEAIIATHEALAKFRHEISQYSIRTELVIGTAALREAKDATSFIQDAKKRSGFDIRIVAGEEEARLAALAILSGDRQASGVVADFGGGSLELAKLGSGKILSKVSLKLGAHYLKSFPDRNQIIDSKLQQTLLDYPEFSEPENLYVIGGSWRSLAKAYLQDAGRDISNLDKENFGKEITGFCRKIEKMSPADLIERYAMEMPRAQLMDVSAIMLEKIITILRPEQIRVSAAGIRDGLAYDYILSQRH